MAKNIQTVKMFKPRRAKLKIGPFDVNYIKKRRPLIIAWWSAALPGMGHIHLGHYLKGLLLVSGEIILNNFSRLNEAIFYSMTGNFSQVHEVINYNWLSLYCSFFVFAVWDSYRICIDTNKSSLIEEKQSSRELTFGVIDSWGINTLNVRNPKMAYVWNTIFPGLFHICNNKLISGMTLLGWTIIISYYTKIPLMVLYTFTGKFALIPDLIDVQWLLFFPSIYLFSIYDGYAHAVYYNQLFEEEQSYHFKKTFGNNDLHL
ncbi:hypothetical protein [Pontibacillus yanchengensis]|uniref:Uncharacterized protein n=1 Tax=Pontibacillus yanchengensis Y32 TaxID=1385514 RepID=A0A0A2TG10_9BACI|nr:hypothetical protein [Pontibacillus yanchengensis]KGP73348.1 hypothetical protein N782_05585 [Pontibacillus yanchengensis Y32]